MPYIKQTWVDEVLPESATYTISGTGTGQTIALEQTPTVTGSDYDADRMNHIESGIEAAGGGGYGTTECRLTLSSGVPVTTTDQTAKTTVYVTPYNGNNVMLYTGSSWTMHILTELSVSVPGTTDTPFDIFLDFNGGTPLFQVTNWTVDST